MKKTMYALCVSLFILGYAPQSFASCKNSDKAEIINYVPTVVTGTASLLVSGIGYLADGTIFLAGNLLAAGVFCGVPTLGAAGIGAYYFGAEVFNACTHVVYRSGASDWIDTDIGPYAYKETKEWRCPMFVSPQELK